VEQLRQQIDVAAAKAIRVPSRQSPCLPPSYHDDQDNDDLPSALTDHRHGIVAVLNFALRHTMALPMKKLQGMRRRPTNLLRQDDKLLECDYDQSPNTAGTDGDYDEMDTGGFNDARQCQRITMRILSKHNISCHGFINAVPRRWD
jgi:hypothetical protein